MKLLSSSLLCAGLALLGVLPRVAAFLLIAGLATRIAAHVVIGIVWYRTTMSRPWPRVAPITDDDW